MRLSGEQLERFERDGPIFAKPVLMLRGLAVILSALVLNVWIVGAWADTRQECLERWRVLKGDDLLRGIVADGERLAGFVFDEDVWNDASHADKVSMLETFQCMFVGQGPSVDMEVIGHRTKKILGEWRRGRVVVK